MCNNCRVRLRVHSLLVMLYQTILHSLLCGRLRQAVKLPTQSQLHKIECFSALILCFSICKMWVLRMLLLGQQSRTRSKILGACLSSASEIFLLIFLLLGQLIALLSLQPFKILVAGSLQNSSATILWITNMRIIFVRALLVPEALCASTPNPVSNGLLSIPSFCGQVGASQTSLLDDISGQNCHRNMCHLMITLG